MQYIPIPGLSDHEDVVSLAKDHVFGYQTQDALKEKAKVGVKTIKYM